MANCGDTSLLESQCALVETNLDTNVGILVYNNDTVYDIKEKIYKEHQLCYPEVGEIMISALKIRRRGRFFRFSDYMILSKAFVGFSGVWFVYVDVVRVEKNEPMTIMAADQNNPELLEKRKKIAIESVLVDEHTKNMTFKEVPETDVPEKTTKKRKMKSLDRKGSRKKPSLDLSQTAMAATASRHVVDESHDLCGKAAVEVVASESVQKNNIIMEENQQTSVANRLCQEKILTVDADLVDGHTRAEVNDVQSDETLKKAPETDLAMRKSNGTDESHKPCVTVPTENMKQDLGKGEKTADLVKIYQDKNLAPALELVDGHITPRDNVNGSHKVCGEVRVGVAAEDCVILPRQKLDDLLSGAVENDNEGGEGSKLAPNTELVTNPENQLEVKSGPTTEKKKKRKKSTKEQRKMVDEENGVPENQMEGSSGLSTGPATEKKKKRARSSKDLIDQSTAATTTSKEILNDREKVSESIDRVDATSASLPDLRREMLADSHVDAKDQRKMVDEENGVPEKQMEGSSGLSTGPATEKKKKKRVRSSKDLIDQSTAATTTSIEIVNDREKVSESIDRVDATSEAFPDLRGELLADSQVDTKDQRKMVDEENGVLEKPMEASTGLSTGPATEKKKKKRARSSKDLIDQSTVATTTSIEIVNDREKLSESIDRIDATSEAFPDLRGEMLADSQVDTKDQRKMVDEENGVLEKPMEASTGLSTGPATEKKKKKRARSAKDLIDQSTAATTTSKEIVNDREKVSGSIDRVDATSEAFPDLRGKMLAAHVDTIQNENEVGGKVVDKVGTLGSDEATLTGAVKIQAANNLQVSDLVINPHVLVEESKTQDQIGKMMEGNKALEHDSVEDNVDEAKSVMSTKKKTLKKAKAPSKEDTLAASDAQHVEPVVGEEPDNVIRNVLDSLQDKNETQENLDKTGKKSSTKKKHSSKIVESRSSIDVSLSSTKLKEINTRVQPASSGANQLKPRAKNDRNESKLNHSDASVKGAVNSKEVKKTSNTVMVNKSKMNFFKDAESSSDDESRPTSHVSTKTPSYSSSDDDSDVTSTSRRQGNNTAGGTKRFSGSLQEILRSSSSYKKAKLAASQSQPDVFEDESPALDFVPDSQAN